jgi:2'-5' RNA ligase
MNIAVVAYPTMDDADSRWISTFREKHDPQSFRIGVHFTLVFPAEGSPSELASEIAAVARSIPPIAFAIRRTEIVWDALGNRSLVFLVPDEGALEITTLHNRLYAGVLRPFLRADIPFVPHLTIGAAAERSAAQRAAAELDLGSRVVRGRIDEVALVNVGLPIVQTVATYALGDAAGPTTSTRPGSLLRK